MDVIRKFQAEWDRVQIHLSYVKVVSKSTNYKGPTDITGDTNIVMEKTWPDVIANFDRIVTRLGALTSMGNVSAEDRASMWNNLFDAYCKILKVWEIQLAAIPVGASMAREWINVGDHLTKDVISMISKVELEGVSGPAAAPYFANLVDLCNTHLLKVSQSNMVACNKRVLRAINCAKDASATVKEEVEKSLAHIVKKKANGGVDSDEDESDLDDSDDDDDESDFSMNDEWDALDENEIPVAAKAVEALDHTRDALKQVVLVVSKQVGRDGARIPSAVAHLEAAVEEAENISAAVDELANATYTPIDPPDVFQKAEALMQRVRFMGHFVSSAVSETSGTPVQVEIDGGACAALEEMMELAKVMN